MRAFVAPIAAICTVFVLGAQLAQAATIAIPENKAEFFDWQDEWGSIHLNSFADGLNDPGIPSSANGVVATKLLDPTFCPFKDASGGCKDTKPVIPGDIINGDVVHGIKYDIKNSIANCASVLVPTCAVFNGGCPAGEAGKVRPDRTKSNPFSRMRCEEDNKSILGDPFSMVYMPMFDTGHFRYGSQDVVGRSNDERCNNPQCPAPKAVGWQQKIINNCVRDIYHDDEGKGAFTPMAHVFSGAEKASWVNADGSRGLATGSQLPAKYYRYKLKDKEYVFQKKSNFSWAVSTTEPDDKDIVPGTKSDDSYVLAAEKPADGTYEDDTLREINNRDESLAQIKAYRVTNRVTGATDMVEDNDSFIVVDPAPLYDLKNYMRLYKKSGQSTAQYQKGLGTPYAMCPVLGIGETGICDTRPTSDANYAGCNIPIYGVGPAVSVTGLGGGTTTRNNYPVVWSGYAKKWAFITPAEYENIICPNDANCRTKAGKRVYMKPLNTNLVLMTVRSPAYCSNEEMDSNLNDNVSKADLPCVQFFQYSNTEGTPLGGWFVNLYDPTMADGVSSNVAAYVVRHDYNVDSNGKPIATSPVLVGGSPVTFFDATATYYKQTGKKKTYLPAVEASQTTTVGGDVRPGVATTGGGGSYIELKDGTTVAVQLNNKTVRWNGRDENCLEFTNAPGKTSTDGGADTVDVFIPTKTDVEYQSFITAVESGADLGVHKVTGTPCQSRFRYTKADHSVGTNGTRTWNGDLSCAAWSARLACGEVKIISSYRECQRPTGGIASCDECVNATDPDPVPVPEANYFYNLIHNPKALRSMKEERKDVNGMDNVCFYRAFCYSRAVCPGLKTGGHVFCLAPDTKILMADGSEKRIDAIKAGEEVKAFDGKRSTGVLKTAKVKATTLTKAQKFVQINDLKITPLHKLVLANGRAVMAKDVKVGDTILKASGMFEEVTKVETNLPPVDVYNLSLDGADGYIAGGMRVLEYPLPAEGENIEGKK